MTVIQKDPKTAPQKIIVISKEERQIIEKKIRALMEAESIGCLIAADPGNFTYVSGISLPYADQFGTPKAAVILDQKMTVICPPEWHQIPSDQGIECEVEAYAAYEGIFTDALIARVAAHVKNCKTVGMDLGMLPVSFMQKLQALLPEVQFKDVSTGLKKLRMVKTPAEIRMLENAVRIVDRAAVAALNHSEGTTVDVLSYYCWEFAERIRVHIGEFGGSASGNIAALQGSEMRFLSKSPVGVLREGNPIRYEATGSHLGYWADSSRTFYIGDPDPLFEKDYSKNIELKKEAAKLLRAGMKASDIFSAMIKSASEKKIRVFTEAGIGHGVGVTEREAPYLSPFDDTVLEPGMVIVLAIYTFGQDDILICSKDTYEITEGEARLLSWYKNYDRIYAIKGTHARHG